MATQTMPPAYHANNTQPPQLHPSEFVNMDEKKVFSAPLSEKVVSGGSGGDKISFHAYRSKWTSRDIVITSDSKDKADSAYYFRFPQKFSGAWDVTIHKGDNSGPIAAHVTKGALSCKIHVLLSNVATEQEIVMSHKSLLKGSYEFPSLDGQRNYLWKFEKMMRSFNLKCIDQETKAEIAHWRSTDCAKSKEGQLEIDTAYAQEAELLLFTGLAMQEYNREVFTLGVIAASS